MFNFWYLILIYRVTNLGQGRLFCTCSKHWTPKDTNAVSANFSLLEKICKSRWLFWRNMFVTLSVKIFFVYLRRKFFFFIFYSGFLNRRRWRVPLFWWGRDAVEVTDPTKKICILNNPLTLIFRIVSSLWFKIIWVFVQRKGISFILHLCIYSVILCGCVCGDGN